jgi:hypothetical protein
MSAFSIYIPSVYANISESMIKKTFHRMKIGRVNRAILVSQPPSKHNKVYVYFDELYTTDAARNMVDEIQNAKTSRLYYGRIPHVFWVLLENRRALQANERDALVEDAPAVSDENVGDANQSAVFGLNSCGDNEETVECESDAAILTEEENDFVPTPDFSFVSSDYATALENELSTLRSANAQLTHTVQILQHNAQITFDYYNHAIACNSSLSDQLMKWRHLIENNQMDRLRNTVMRESEEGEEGELMVEGVSL